MPFNYNESAVFVSETEIPKNRGQKKKQVHFLYLC